MNLVSFRCFMLPAAAAGLMVASQVLAQTDLSTLKPLDQIAKVETTWWQSFELKENFEFSFKNLEVSRKIEVLGTKSSSLNLLFDGGKLILEYQLASDDKKSRIDSTLDGVKELKLIHRPGVLFVYLVTEDHTFPFVGFDCANDEVLTVNTSGAKDQHLPELYEWHPTHVLNHLIDESARGVAFSGEWNYDTTHSVPGIWRSDSNNSQASASLAIQGVLKGEHEIWIHNPVNSSSTKNALVHVKNGSQIEELEIDLSQGQGLWIGVGRYQVSTSEGVLDLTLATTVPSAGALSLDRVLCVWSNWEDVNNDGVPDVVKQASLRQGSVAEEWNALMNRSQGGLHDRKLETQGAAMTAFGYPINPETGQILYYADSEIGDDENDGSAAFIQVGSWVGQRSGPKKTLAGLQVFHNEERPVLLKLNGTFEELSSEFRTFKGPFGIEGGALGAHFGTTK